MIVNGTEISATSDVKLWFGNDLSELISGNEKWTKSITKICHWKIILKTK